MSGKQLVYCETKFVWAVSQLAPISSLSLLPTHINGIPAPYEDSIYIFRNDFILFPYHTVLCDRFDVCFREERLRVETISLIFSQSNHRYLQCTDDDNRSYRSVCNMSFVSFSLAVIFIIRLFSTSAFRVPNLEMILNPDEVNYTKITGKHSESTKKQPSKHQKNTKCRNIR